MGPSPRARGAERPRLPRARETGSIPACAGSSARGSPSAPRAGVHPRVRGEQMVRRSSRLSLGGPSLRALGAVNRWLVRWSPSGSIPACAGSSIGRRALAPAGEGPSLRARGAGCLERMGPAARGSIPACAGSRLSRTNGTCCSWVHPCVRGEQAVSNEWDLLCAGPSLRARGAAGRLGHHVAEAGVHPCVRGEQAVSNEWDLLLVGPSLRARGAGCLERMGPAARGSIPACAGSRLSRTNGTCCSWVHPCVRGEQAVSNEWDLLQQGPSLRARGAVVVRSRGIQNRIAGPSLRARGAVVSC